MSKPTSSKTQSSDKHTLPPFVTEMPLSMLHPNEGQIDGLPANPRYITEEKMELLKQNIAQYPEMLQYRTLLAYEQGKDNYVIIGGNMRYRAMQALGIETAPVAIIPKDTPTERLKAYAILDNNGFGRYDWDILANEWDEQQLKDWGVDLPVLSSDVNIDDFFNSETDEQHKDGQAHLAIIIPAELADKKDEIKAFIETAIAGNYNGIIVK